MVYIQKKKKSLKKKRQKCEGANSEPLGQLDLQLQLTSFVCPPCSLQVTESQYLPLRSQERGAEALGAGRERRELQAVMIRLQRARGAASKPQLGSPVWHVATAQAERVPEARLQAGGQDGLARRGSDTESCEVTLWKLSGNNWS